MEVCVQMYLVILMRWVIKQKCRSLKNSQQQFEKRFVLSKTNYIDVIKVSTVKAFNNNEHKEGI